MNDRVPDAFDLTERMPHDAFDPEDGATIRVVRQDEPDIGAPLAAPRAARGTRPHLARVSPTATKPPPLPPGLPARAKRWTQLPPPLPPPRVPPARPSGSIAAARSSAPIVPPPAPSFAATIVQPPPAPSFAAPILQPPSAPSVAARLPSRPMAAPQPGHDTSAFAAWLLPEGEVADSTWFERAESVPVRRQRAATRWPYVVGVVLVGAVIGAAIVLFARRDPDPTTQPPKVVAARANTTRPAPAPSATPPAPTVAVATPAPTVTATVPNVTTPPSPPTVAAATPGPTVAATTPATTPPSPPTVTAATPGPTVTATTPVPTAAAATPAPTATATTPAASVTATTRAPTVTAPPPAVATRASKASRPAKTREPAIERRTPAASQPHKHTPARPAPATARATATAGGHGNLRVVITPPCEIAIDGKSTKLRSPQENLRLPVGTHRVTLTNAGANIRRTIELTIAPGKTTQLVRDFTAQ